MASITTTFTETAAPGAASDELFVRPDGSFTWSSVGTIDAGCEVALQWCDQPGAWRDIKRWLGGASGASVSETGRVLNGTSGPRRYRFHATVPTTDPATVLTSYEVSATEVADVLEETRAPDGTSVFKITESGVESPLVTATAVSTDTISEKTAAAGVTIDGLQVKDGGLVLTTGRIQHNHAGTSGAIIRGFGKTSAEGWQEMVIEQTISFVDNVALYKNIDGANLAAGSVVVGALANIESALTGGGTTVKVGIGTSDDPDVYGLSAALTKNAKITPLPVWTPLASQTAVRLYACASNGAAGDTALTAGSVRVRLLVLTPIQLADAP